MKQVLIPREPYASDVRLLMALCVWREARGQSPEAKLGVIHVIRNRCAMAPAQGFKADPVANILKPWAFSSFMESDPNSVKYPDTDEVLGNSSVWQECLDAVDSVEADPTLGAVFYFSAPLAQPPHAWGAVRHTADIDGLHFFTV